MARKGQTLRSPRKLPAVASPPAKPAVLISDVRALILQAREGVARAVDSTLTALYRSVGRRIRQDILNEKRAEYGEKIVHALSAQLQREFGRGFGQELATLRAEDKLMGRRLVKENRTMSVNLRSVTRWVTVHQ